MMRTACFAWLFLLAVSSAPLLGQQGEFKPILVAAVAPVDDVFADVDYLTKLFGDEDSGKMARQMSGPFLAGIDRKRPSGAYIAFPDDEVIGVAFAPVTLFKAHLAMLEGQLGKPEELAGGVFKFALPPDVQDEEGEPADLFLKEQDGWAFYAYKAEHLASLPKDPVALLGGLEKKYDVGLRFVAENVSAESRQTLLDFLKGAFERSQFDSSEVPEAWMQAFEEATLRYVAGTKSIDIGLTVDSQQANVAISLAIEPIAGSELATSFDSVKSLTTSHPGVVVPGAAVVIHRAAKLNQDDIKVWDSFFDHIFKEMTETPLPEEKRAIGEEALPLLIRAAKAGHADGTVDWGMSYIVNDDGKLTTLSGYHMADLEKLVADSRALLEKHRNADPDLADLKIEWDFAMHGKVRIIKLTLPEALAREGGLGDDESSLYLGIDGNYVYSANGHDALKHLKAAIERSAAKPSFKAAPFRMRIDARQLVNLAKSTLGADDPTVAEVVKTLEDARGKTSINLNLLPGEAGLEGRLEIGEGVLRAGPQAGQLALQVFLEQAQPKFEIPEEEPGAIEPKLK
jgi:hypothetical protein